MVNIFNEKKYAEELLEKGFMSNKQGLELFILAKYYRFEYNIKRSECKKLLVDFCKSQISDYEYTDMYIKLNSALNRAYKKNRVKFLKIDEIEFNEYELMYINSLNISAVAKQIVFGLWCCNKLNIKAGQSDKWLNISYQDLKKFCNLRNGDMFKLMHEIYENGLIFVTDKGALSLLFLDKYKEYFDMNYSEQTIVTTYFIRDFLTCGLWWQQYNGNKMVTKCKNCDKLFYRKSKNQQYCSDCRPYKNMENKIIQCVDCGKEFKLYSKDTRTCRCEECYKIYRRKKKAETMRKLRLN